MATVTRGLPKRPHLDVPKREARELLSDWEAGRREAWERIRGRHPKFKTFATGAGATTVVKLADAQLVIAREYGFGSWPELKRRIEASDVAEELQRAIGADDCGTVVRLLRATPEMLHLPLRSRTWGPPMSYAATLGRLEIVRAVAELGATDYQHAFDRAILTGHIECARWLHAHGAKLVPGIVMGACETLNPDGLQFLADVHAPFTDQKGNQLAPLAHVLQTYSRDRARKHRVLEIFAAQGYAFPDTPMMAFHRGRLDLLAGQLDRDRGLLERRFALTEIYPPGMGCSKEGGMHGTPLAGTTLLHLAIDFQEDEIFALLLARGADVNARAAVDADGFGGHTPLFHIAVGSRNDAVMARALLERGASPEQRASLRKFLDWREKPAWHEARNVTPAEWARDFPERSWVNQAALELFGRLPD